MDALRMRWNIPNDIYIRFVCWKPPCLRQISTGNNSDLSIYCLGHSARVHIKLLRHVSLMQ